jgi:ABC-type lipoprotein release transport system permease subunit
MEGVGLLFIVIISLFLGVIFGLAMTCLATTIKKKRNPELNIQLYFIKSFPVFTIFSSFLFFMYLLLLFLTKMS